VEINVLVAKIIINSAKSVKLGLFCTNFNALIFALLDFLIMKESVKNVMKNAIRVM
jgi:hypothetical protein